MSVSQNTQRGLYARSCDETHFARDVVAAEVKAKALRATGLYQRIEMRRWNNGTRQQARWEYKIMAWRKA